jgi:hypothetical protein
VWCVWCGMWYVVCGDVTIDDWCCVLRVACCVLCVCRFILHTTASCCFSHLVLPAGSLSRGPSWLREAQPPRRDTTDGQMYGDAHLLVTDAAFHYALLRKPAGQLPHDVLLLDRHALIRSGQPGVTHQHYFLVVVVVTVSSR